MQLSLEVDPSGSKTASTKTEFYINFEMATQVKSRLFSLQSITGQHGVAYRHIILLALPLVSDEVGTQISKNCSRRQPHSHLRSPPRVPPRMSACTLYFQKLESLAYIYVADSVGLSSFKFVQRAPKDASCLHQSAFWPFKVTQGR